jgi:hypothetical protein
MECINITLPHQMPWASMNVYAMRFCEMQNLRTLSIRCRGEQEDSILSPEAAALLFSSKKIESLYLEIVGLIDDHVVDVMAQELPQNNVLTLLNVMDNLFTDDALYTIDQALSKLNKLTTLDLSGGGIKHLKLEGDEERSSTMVTLALLLSAVNIMR